MKVLTLNVHAWLENDAPDKLQALIDHLLIEDYDWIALQEVNQTIGGTVVSDLSQLMATDCQHPIVEDNYAFMLVQALQEKGLAYYWAWAYNHIAYDRFEEGVALLAKKPFMAQRILLSAVDDPQDYHTRAALLASDNNLQVVSCHLSWWKEAGGFQDEWKRLVLNLNNLENPSILLGDFNAPSHRRNESYDLATEYLQDAFYLAAQREGNATIPGGIDGWSSTERAQRIDLVLMTPDFTVNQYRSVLDGVHGPIVSDHYGVAVDFHP